MFDLNQIFETRMEYQKHARNTKMILRSNLLVPGVQGDTESNLHAWREITLVCVPLVLSSRGRTAPAQQQGQLLPSLLACAGLFTQPLTHVHTHLQSPCFHHDCKTTSIPAPRPGSHICRCPRHRRCRRHCGSRRKQRRQRIRCSVRQ